MSDYLWDKSGEADPEVEQLEQLLGALRHRPAAIELPPAAAPRPARRFASLFRPAALAAAALALAALAGALLLLRDAGRRDHTASAVNAPPAATAEGPQSPGQSGEPSQTPARPGEPGQAVPPSAPERASSNVSPQKHVGKHRASVPVVNVRNEGRRPRQLAGAGPRQLAGAGSRRAARDEAGRPEVSRAEAKERLLYALRLASVKLEEVRRVTSGTEGEDSLEGPRGRTR